jgi:hypothetical protein
LTTKDQKTYRENQARIQSGTRSILEIASF